LKKKKEENEKLKAAAEKERKAAEKAERKSKVDRAEKLMTKA
jgi:hypothetical protein